MSIELLQSDLTEALKICLESIEKSGLERSRSGELTRASFVELTALVDNYNSESTSAPEFIRTIHHFACTGGTLVSKFLASMANVHLLSEVDPFSQMIPARGQKFYPTDLIALLRTGSRPCSQEIEGEIFLAGLSVIFEECCRKGFRLVLRDHAHSKYCLGSRVSGHPSLLDLVRTKYLTKSIVTVRHPLDSFLSLSVNRWLHFDPPELEEYSLRYLEFIADCSNLPVFRYEEMIDSPADTVMAMCDKLRLPFNSQFINLFSVHALSGDSGRKSSAVGARERRITPENVKNAALRSASYRKLCDLLEYDYEPWR